MAQLSTLALGIDSSGVKAGADAFEAAVDRIKTGAGQTVAATEGLSDAMSRVRDVAQGAAVAFGLYKFTAAVQEVAMLAGRYNELGVVLSSVGKNAGYSGKYLDDLENSLKKTGISAIQSRQSIASMIQAQLDLGSATKLARVAQDAAVIGQLNSSEAMQRLIHGITSGNIETLRTMGVQANFRIGYEKLAAATGRTVEMLSEQEKVQARLNVVMESGAGIAGAYEASMTSATKQLRSSVRYVEDLKVGIGQLFQPAMNAAVFLYVDTLKFFQHHMELSKGLALAVTTAMGAFATVLGLVTARVIALKVMEGYALVMKTVQLYTAGAVVVTQAQAAAMAAEAAAAGTATVATIAFSSAVKSLMILTGIGAIILGAAAALVYWTKGASDSEKVAKALGTALQDTERHAMEFGKTLAKPVVLKVESSEEAKKALEATTAATNQFLAAQVRLTSAQAQASEAGAGRRFNAELLALDKALIGGSINLTQYEERLQALSTAFPEYSKTAAEADKYAVQLLLLKGRTEEVEAASKAMSERQRMLTNFFTGQKTALGELNVEMAKFAFLQNNAKPASFAAASVETSVVKTARLQAEQEVANQKLITDARRTAGEAGVKAAKITIQAQAEASKSWAEFTQAQAKAGQPVLEFSEALKSNDRTIRESASSLLHWTRVGLEAKGATEDLTKATDERKNAVAALRETQLRATATQLKSSGDLIGAINAETQVDLNAIKTKYDKLVATRALTATEANAGRAAESAAVRDREALAIAEQRFTAQRRLTEAYNQSYLLRLTQAKDEAGVAREQLRQSQEATLATLDQEIALKKIPPQLGAQLRAQLLLNQALERGIVAQRTMAEAAQKNLAQFDAYVEKLKQVWAEVPNMVQSAVQSGYYTLRTFFEDIWTDGLGAFEKLAKGVLKIMQQLFADLASRSLVRALFGSGDAAESTQDILNKIGDKVTKWLKGLKDKIGNGGIGAIAGAVVGAGIGYSTGSTGLGALSGAAAGFAIGGPIGGIVGGVAGLVGGLFGHAKKAKEAAERMAEATKAFQLSLSDYVAEATGTATDLSRSLLANEAKVAGLKKTAKDLLQMQLDAKGGSAAQDIANYVATIKKVDEASAAYIKKLEEEAAIKSERVTQDLNQRIRTAQAAGLEGDALLAATRANEDYAREVKNTNDRLDASRAGWTAAQLALLDTAQAEEALAVVRVRALEDTARAEAERAAQKAEAERKAQEAEDAARASRDLMLDVMRREAGLTGDLSKLKEYNLAVLKAEHDDALAAAGKLLDAGTITETMYMSLAGVLNDEMKRAVDSVTGSIGQMSTAAEILKANADALSQQFDVFQTGLADQVRQLGDLYGFSGKSEAELLAMYTKVTPGQELTESQKTLNDEIAKYLRLSRESDAAAQRDAAAANPSTAGGTPVTSPVTSGSGSVVYTGPVEFVINLNVDPATFKDAERTVDMIKERMSREMAAEARRYNTAGGRL